MTTEYGIRWLYRDGTTHVGVGYARHVAQRLVAEPPVKGCWPVADAVLYRECGNWQTINEGAAVSEQQTIWREGNRIRRTDGTGYSDMVSDAEIWSHVAADDGTDPLFQRFATAVIAIRDFERASEGQQ